MAFKTNFILSPNIVCIYITKRNKSQEIKKNYKMLFFSLDILISLCNYYFQKGQKMQIIEKLGGYQNVLEILKNMGWKSKNPYGTLVVQAHRKSLAKDVSLALMDYCQKHNIPVSIEDFKA